MNDINQHAPRILVIANRTCPCPTLVDEIARRVGTGDSEVLVIAPALNSRMRHWVSDVDKAIARAHHRVGLALDGLREHGISARGEVGDANPLLAIADALASFPATEIVIVTHPPGESNWLEHRLIERATSEFDLPITHLVSAFGLTDQLIAA